MILTLLKHRRSRIITTLFSSLFLIGCGGGSSPESPNLSQLSGAFEETANAPQAVSIASSHTELVSLQARAENTQFNVEDTGENLAISIGYLDIASATHTQIFLNTDNNPSTGFGFNGIAWGAIGADYMIQNQYLYRSTSNTAVWDWEPVSKLNSYVRTDSQIEISLDKNLIGAACGTIKAGTVGRNESWGIEAMYPVATEMLSIPLAACSEDVIRPTVKLIGDAEISITQGEVFNDPGASAIDDVDGDISELINISGSVNTALTGVYTLVYTSTDSSGNVAISPIRKVTVVESEVALPPIALNGNWDNLINKQLIFNVPGNLVSYAHQDQWSNNIYLELNQAYGDEAAHVQIYLDTDNDPNTGYQVWNSRSPDAALTGAEYIIEDGRMTKYIGNGIDWNWSPEIVDVPYTYQYTEAGDDGQFSVPNLRVRAIFPYTALSRNKVGITMIKVVPDWSRYLILAYPGIYNAEIPDEQ
jgi:hypothetical protein